jgi:hypothetical protein
MKGLRGYILVEAVTAMAVLSITAVTAQRAVHTAVLARGLAQDYTTAQFLLERLAADRALEPRIAAGESHSGTFPPPDERFAYAWSLELVEIPLVDLPTLGPEQRDALKRNLLTRMGKLRMEVRWTRGGEPFSASAETLVSPERTWVGPVESAP